MFLFITFLCPIYINGGRGCCLLFPDRDSSLAYRMACKMYILKWRFKKKNLYTLINNLLLISNCDLLSYLFIYLLLWQTNQAFERSKTWKKAFRDSYENEKIHSSNPEKTADAFFAILVFRKRSSRRPDSIVLFILFSVLNEKL